MYINERKSIFPWPICQLLNKQKEHFVTHLFLVWVQNFETKFVKKKNRLVRFTVQSSPVIPYDPWIPRSLMYMRTYSYLLIIWGWWNRCSRGISSVPVIASKLAFFRRIKCQTVYSKMELSNSHKNTYCQPVWKQPPHTIMACSAVPSA